MRVARSSLVSFFVGVCLVLVLAVPATADIIHLSSGRQVQGRILEDDGEEVRVQTRLGVITVSWDEIERIERVDDPAAEFERRFRDLSDDDAAAAFRLAEWARERGLEDQAARAYWRTIRADPEHEEARERLGHVRYRGEWMPQDEARRRQGYVRWEGRWVTAEEREKLEAGLVQLADGSWVPREQAPDTARRVPLARRRDGDEEAAPRTADADPGRPDDGGGGGAEPGPAAEPVPADPDRIEQQLAMQRAFAEEAERRLGLEFETVEEGPLLVHTTHSTDSEPFREFLRTLGRIYEQQRTVYDIPEEARIWPGKLQIFFFASKEEFDQFAIQVDDAGGAIQSGGYFVEGVGANGEIKFHVTMYDMSTGTLAHELSHAFMSRYNHSEARVSPWLNEGTAEFMRYYCVEGQSERRHRYQVSQMQLRDDARLSLREMFAKRRISGTEGWAYAVSWSLVDFMIHAEGGSDRGRRFVDFLQSIKAPDAEPWSRMSADEQIAVLEETFETTADRFEAAWHDYIESNYR